jgi:hypothetical protein
MSIATIVEEHGQVFSRSNCVLIGCIDSHPNPNLMPFARKFFEEDDTPLSEQPFVLSGSQFARLTSNYNLFTGFDEIWLASVVPTLMRPEEASLVAPVNLDFEMPGAIAEWMAASQCVLGLGDGWGVNFVATNRDVVAELGLISDT